MQSLSKPAVLLCACFLCASLFLPRESKAQFSGAASASSALSIPKADVIQPEALQASLQSGEKPLVLQVGSHVMFTQAHIPGAQYAGPGSQPSGLQLLESRLAKTSKAQSIVLYCGCCPWNRCPNVGPAYHRLHDLGFTHVKVLYIADNFGQDWVAKGYRADKGE
ncbi:MAG TPA: rhodanese-like domain-containing protein [Terracidiphilus sp.]|nr:rhodanese-like domain-containing protein [Terracidiphilus sp.]